MSKLIFTRIALSFLLFLSLGAFKAQGQATVSTDLLDYPPGSTAIITGSGFQAGETVTLQVLHEPTGGDDATDPSHLPWTVVADGNGNISSTWLVPGDADELGATLRLTAVGATSGLQAAWVFTDATDGSGTMSVSPTTACAGASGNSFTFTFSHGNGGANFTAGSQLQLTIPGGWSTPQSTSSGSAGFISIAAVGGGSVSINSISGNVITLDFTTANNSTTTITYSNVTASSTTGPHTFITKSKGTTTLTTLTNGSPVVTVNSAAAITTPQPANQSITYGAIATFTVAATGTPTLTYQWQEFTSSWNDITNGGVYSNATTATLTLTKATVAMSGRKYRCVVTNTCGTATTDGNATLTVTVKSLTAALTGTVTKIYDATTTATLAAGNYSLPGVVSGDVVTLNNPTSGSYNTKDVGTSKTVSVSGLSISGANAGNYSLSATTASANIGTITTKALTATASAANKVYDGTTAATVTLNDNRIAGDVFTAAATSATFANKNVGNGKTVTVTGISISGTDAGNYTLTSTTTTATANITASFITVTASTNTKTYDGTTSAAATPTITSGTVQTGDVANFTEVYNNKNAGSGKTLTPSGTVTDGNSGNNYVYTFVNDVTGVINQRVLTITGAATTKVYDGTTSSATSPGITSGAVQTGDAAAFTQTYDNKNAGTSKVMTPTGIVNDGNSGNNYTYSFVTSSNGTITKRTLNVTGAQSSKTYDGTTSSPSTPAITGIQTGDIANFIQLYDNKNVGTAKTLIPSGSVNDGNSGNNYNVTFNNLSTGANRQITARALTVTAATDTKTYDGNTSSAAIPTVTSGAVQTGDAANFTEVYSTSSAGTGKTLIPSGTVTDGNAGNNYTYTFVNNTTGVITKATATVTVNGYTGVYDAAAHGATGSATGVAGDPSAAGSTLNLGASFTNVPGGTANWTFTGGTNYTDQSGSVAIVITKAAATVNVSGYTGVYDAAAHGASGTATGVASFDLSAGLNFGASFTDVPGGTANWTFTGGTNYTDQSGSVAIVITKATATVSVSGYTGVYDAAAHGATGSATGVAGDPSATGSSLNLGASFTNVPGGTANWTFTGGTNYTDQNGSVAIVITKATATVNVSGYTGVYDAAAHGASGTATGVASVDLSAGLNFGASFTDVPGGTANWTFTGGTNYTDQNGSVAIVITKATATVNVSGYTGVYDAAAHGASGTATGVASVDLSAGLSFGASFTDVPGGTANWTFSGGTNYADQSGTAAIVITKATATVTVNGYTGVYDAAAHGATGSAAGVTGDPSAAGSTLNLGASFTNVPGGTANWTFTGGTNYTDQSGSVAIVITKATATVNVSGYTGVYDAAAHGASGTATGVASVDLSAGLNFGASFTDVPGGTANWTFTGGTNYTDQNGSVAIVITKATATVSVSGYTGVYDAAAHGATGSATGVAGNPSATGSSLNLGASFTNVPGGTANWTFTGGTNYTDQNGSVAIVITKATATVNVSGYTGVYDAAAHGATGSATGVAGDLSAAGSSLNLGASFTDVPGGTANWSFIGGTNYTDQSGTAAIVINKATATVIVNGYTGIYDASAHGATGSATGVAGDLSAAGSSLNLGASFTDVPGGTANWSFIGGTNYTDQSGTAAIVINKATATVTVNGYAGIYDAAAHGATGSATGVAGDLSAAGSSLNLGASFTNVPGGTANWTFTGGTNYTDQSGTAAIVITKATATVNVSGHTGVYDAAAHGASGTATGVAGADLSAGLSFGASFTDVPGGIANWTFSGGTNYADQSGTAAIVITKATATVTVNGYTGVYDAAAHGATGSAAGVAGDLSAAGSSLSLGASFTNVPGGTANWTFTGGTNYTDQSGTAAIVITKATATVNVSGYTGVYDAAAHGASGTATGVAGVDLSAGLNFGASFTGVPGGTANWTFSGGTNYADQSGTAAIVITKATATVTVNGYTGVYDAAAHGATGSAAGVAGDPSAAGSSLNLGASFTNVPGGTASWTFTGGTNYNNQSGTAAIVITKADAVVTVNGYTGTYNAAAHGATGSALGVAGDPTAAGSTLNLGASFTNVPGGTANWTFTGGTNYNNQSGTAAIIITKADAVVTVNGYTGVYNAATHGATGSAVGVAGDPTAAGSTLNLGASFTNVPGGTANWTFTGGTNYNNQSGTATIVINKANSTVSITGGTFNYDGNAHGASGFGYGIGGIADVQAPAVTFYYTGTNCAGSYSSASAPTAPGTYSVVATFAGNTNYNGSSSATATVSIVSTLTATASGTNNLCNGASAGSATVTVTGGKTPYTYLWSNGSTTQAINGLAAGTYNVTVTDANSCTKSSSYTVTQPTLLTASASTNSNPIIWFGYSGDQTDTITVKPSGGVGPYKVTITMNRPLSCNVITNTGDEIWAPQANTDVSLNAYATCPSSGSSLFPPSSTSNSTITSATGYSLYVTLVKDAIITATITDANGCTTVWSTSIHAEDVRCFAGNSGVTKVSMCHRTGSVKNPCVQICVDASAVQEHLAHGDFVGTCTSNCVAPQQRVIAPAVTTAPAVDRQVGDEKLSLKVMPNPTTNYFNVEIKGKDASPVTVRVMNIYGKVIQVNQKIGSTATLRLGENWTNGTYLIEVIQGNDRKLMKVVKAN